MHEPVSVLAGERARVALYLYWLRDLDGEAVVGFSAAQLERMRIAAPTRQDNVRDPLPALRRIGYLAAWECASGPEGYRLERPRPLLAERLVELRPLPERSAGRDAA